MSKYTISRFENNITLNPKEYVLDDNDIIEFDTIDLAKKYLTDRGIACFDGYYFDEVINSDNVEDACCCWDEDDKYVYGMESISPTKMRCIGCKKEWDEDGTSVGVEDGN